MATVQTSGSTDARLTSSTDVATTRTRRVATAGLLLAIALGAVVLGTIVGHRLTGPQTVAPPALPTGVVSYPDDWQQYRAGERSGHVFLDEPWHSVGGHRGG